MIFDVIWQWKNLLFRKVVALEHPLLCRCKELTSSTASRWRDCSSWNPLRTSFSPIRSQVPWNQVTSNCTSMWCCRHITQVSVTWSQLNRRPTLLIALFLVVMHTVLTSNLRSLFVVQSQSEFPMARLPWNNELFFNEWCLKEANGFFRLIMNYLLMFYLYRSGSLI